MPVISNAKIPKPQKAGGGEDEEDVLRHNEVSASTPRLTTADVVMPASMSSSQMPRRPKDIAKCITKLLEEGKEHFALDDVASEFL